MPFCCWSSSKTWTPEKIVNPEPPREDPPIPPRDPTPPPKFPPMPPKEEIPTNEDEQRRRGIIPNPMLDEVEIAIHEKSKTDAELIKTAIANNEFLNQVITGKKLDEMVNAMYKENIEAKEYIMRKGDNGDKMYVLHKGRLHFKGDGFDFEHDKPTVFGELAILYKAGRLATIKALSHVEVWVLESSVYYQIMHKYIKEEHNERMQFLRKVKTLQNIQEDLLQAGADALEKEFFKAGSAIVRQGDRGDKFYIIRAGSVTISKEGEGEIGKLQQGQSFGELALKQEDCRQATVTANAPGVECLTLTREHFDLYFNNLEIIMIEPQEIGENFVDLKLTDFNIVRTLGMGAFGRVELVMRKKTQNEIFALKYLKKQYIVEQGLQEHIFNEKILQISCDSRFIVRSYRTFKDSKYVYFLMEACLGGDLFSLLHRQKNKRFEEKDAKFIAGCVLEALHYLHTRGIIFRDLKPENIMIDTNGYMKLTDFGYAKRILGRGKTFTFAGTPEYVAPEILLNNGHDKGVDYWAFGCLVFELLSGKTPFRTNDPNHIKTYNKILAGEVVFNSIINNKARTLIEKLLRPYSKDRLGMQKNGVEDIRRHVWFHSFDWDHLRSGKMTSSFKPRLGNITDTRYFEKFSKDTDIPADENSGWDEKF